MSEISFVTLDWIKQSTDGYALIDENVAAHFEPGCEALVIPSGEKSKSAEQLVRCWEWLVDQGVRPGETVYGIGGGVVTDLAGFVAATLFRGTRFVAVPTSLLAMVDAAVGGKNGINLPHGKNLVGTIREPEQIWVGMDFLQTLSDRHFRTGLAEVIKYGVLEGEEFLRRLERSLPTMDQELIAACIESKQRIIRSSNRDFLNFGHTLGHAIEGWSKYAWHHGEAVSAGMVYAMRLGEELGVTPAGYADRIEALCKKVGLPTEAPSIDPLIPWMRQDKKRLGEQIRFALCRRWGELEMREVDLCVS